VPLINLKVVKQNVRIAQVLGWLHWQPVSKQRDELRGDCPFHATSWRRSKCFSVNTRIDCFHCFKCGEKGNALELFARVRKLTLHAAAIEICQLAGMAVPYLNAPEQRRGASPNTARLAKGRTSQNGLTARTFPVIERRDLPFTEEQGGIRRWIV
jgi:DNA primase